MGEERGVQVENVILRVFFPNCSLPSSVSQLFLSLIVVFVCVLILWKRCIENFWGSFEIPKHITMWFKSH